MKFSMPSSSDASPSIDEDDLHFYSKRNNILESFVPLTFISKIKKISKKESADDATHLYVKSLDKEFLIHYELNRDKLERVIYLDDKTLLIEKNIINNRSHYFLSPKIYSKSSLESYIGLETKNINENIEKLPINQIEIGDQTIFSTIIKHLWQQYFLLFFFYEIILILNGRVLQPLFSIIIQVPFYCFEAFVEQWKLNQLKATIKRDNIDVSVKRTGKWITINSSQLQVGDLVSIGSMKPNTLIPCDILLIHGKCITDESSLDGESTPVIKDPILDYPNDYVFDQLSDSKMHLLFSGTILKNVNHLEAKDNSCYGLVIKTGFNTIRGQIIRQALDSLSSSGSNIKIVKQVRPIIIIMLFIGFLGSIYYYRIANTQEFREIRMKANPDTIANYNIIVQALLIISSIMPSDIQTNIFFILNKGLASLLTKNIYSSEPSNLLLMSNCNVICFDKTGTLTKNEISVHGIVEFTTKKESFKDDESFDEREKYSDEGLNANLIQKASNLNVDLMSACLGCHQLIFDSKKAIFIGDELEKNLMNFVKGKVYAHQKGGQIDQMKTEYSKIPDNINILKTFQFSSKLARMSTVLSIGQDLDKVFAIIKGSPEVIFCHQKNNNNPYLKIANDWSKKGFRILALAKKNLGKLLPNDIENLTREDVESDITPIGLIIGINPLKQESFDVIKILKRDRGIAIKIITGDNPLTSIAVCNNLGLVVPDNTFEILDINVQDRYLIAQPYYKDESSQKLTKTTIRFDLDKIESPQISNKYFYIIGSTLKRFDEISLRAIVKICTVFARASPKQKGDVIAKLQLDGSRTMMVGDGANDIIAMRQATSSFSLSSNETKLLSNQSHDDPQSSMPTASSSAMRTFWNFISKYSNNDNKHEFSLCTIGSSFFTNSSDPTKLIDILKQSKASTAMVKYFALISLNCAIFEFFFTLIMLKSHIKLSESQLMLDAYMLFFASTFAMSIKTNVDEKLPDNLIVKSNSLYSIKMISTFVLSMISDLSILLYMQNYVLSNFTSKCDNGLDMTNISPCKTIFMYLFVVVELISFFVYYPGRKFLTPLSQTTLIKFLIFAISMILMMASSSISPGNALEPIKQFEFPSDFFHKFLVQIAINFVLKMITVLAVKPYD